MHPLVQSALKAAQNGNKNGARQLLKQAITSNPNDTEAMLILAGLSHQPDQKRKILNRVLIVEPSNQMAREEMSKLDRMAMGTFRSEISFAAELYRLSALPSNDMTPRIFQPQARMSAAALAPVRPQTQSHSAGKSITQPVHVKNTFTKWNWVEESPTVKPRVAVELDRSLITEKPLVFKYPLFLRILVYFCAAFFGFVGLLVASQNTVNSLPFLGLAALMGLIAMAVSPMVEVSDAGLRASGIFTSAEIGWDEIDELKAVPTKRRLELTRKRRGVVKVSTQVSGYPRIVELIRQRRPDLFGAATAPRSQGNSYSSEYQSAPSIAYVVSSDTSSFRETRTFRKSFFRQYGILFIVIPLFFLSIWTTLTGTENRVVAFIAAGFCGIMTILPFFQVSSITVEPDKLTIETTFEEKVLSAREVKEIKLRSVRGRSGHITHYVNITAGKGKNYSLQGFSDGDEILHGTLLNWWDSYRDD